MKWGLGLIISVYSVCFLCGELNVCNAFDVAVYYDARSGVNWRSSRADTNYCWDNSGVSRNLALSRIENQQDVWTWFDEMGVDYAIVHYPFPDDFTFLTNTNLGAVKVLNGSYP